MHRPVVAVIAIVGLAVALGVGLGDIEAHSGHPHKKLFNARWYQSQLDLTTSYNDPKALMCDGSYTTCANKWNSAIGASLADWNSQPDTARFIADGFFDENEDVVIRVFDKVFDDPNILGIALTWDASGNFCPLHSCGTFRWGEAWIGDDGHVGAYGTTQARQVTITHELGHLLSLRHESVNGDESQLYECGFDNTGPIPPSVMSYDCINPTVVGGSGIINVQDWDVCGVNHAYPDPVFEWESCVCYAPPSGPAPPPGPLAYYHPVTPARILDTRSGPGPTGRLGYGCHIDVQVTDVGNVPASGVSAVVLNVTVAQPSRGSFLTVYPSDAGLPTASNLNFVAGQTVPNLVTVKVGPDGKVKVYNAGGQTHVIFDVVGWYGDTPDDPPPMPSPTPTPDPGGYGLYHPLPPTRIMDTRIGRGWPGKLGHNGTATVDVTDTFGSGVPASGVTAVVVNTTVTEPTAGSYLTVYPTGVTQPLASNLNFGPGQTVPNLVIVKVGAGGAADGKVNVYNAVGQVHVIFDVVGWYGGAGADGTLFHSLSPARIMDTRINLGWFGALGHNGTATVDVTGVGGVPDGAKAVVVNATVTQPTGGSFLTVWPSNATRPNASNLNFGLGQTVPNLVMVKVPTTGPTAGRVNVYNAVGQVHVIFDVVGYFE
jgi:hypothetical protein